MELLSIVAALGLSPAAGVADASTVSVTVRGQANDVGIFSGRFWNRRTLLKSQVFRGWGAMQSAEAHGSSDGALNTGVGLFFAFGPPRPDLR